MRTGDDVFGGSLTALLARGQATCLAKDKPALPSDGSHRGKHRNRTRAADGAGPTMVEQADRYRSWTCKKTAKNRL